MVGLVAAVWLALWQAAPAVTLSPTDLDQQLNRPGDTRSLYLAASRATWEDVPHWLTGSWIYAGVQYYRPLTSILFLAENRAFGRDFTAYNRVSWLLHGLNAALLYLLAVGLLGHRRRLRGPLAFMAVYYFASESASLWSSVSHSVYWYPAQNDLLSLTFGLAFLLLLDAYLRRGRGGEGERGHQEAVGSRQSAGIRSHDSRLTTPASPLLPFSPSR